MELTISKWILSGRPSHNVLVSNLQKLIELVRDLISNKDNKVKDNPLEATSLWRKSN